MAFQRRNRQRAAWRTTPRLTSTRHPLIVHNSTRHTRNQQGAPEMIMPDNDALMLLAVGAAAGCALCAAISALVPTRSSSAPLARRIEKLEMRLAATRNMAAVTTALTGLSASAPRLAEAGSRILLADARLDARNDASPDDVARAFGEAMRDNTVAAVGIARAIIDESVNLNDAKDRRRVADRTRDEARKLTTTFWDRHGELLLASGLPENLKDLLRVFFAQVRRLKTAIAELVRDPTFADLDAVLDHAIALIDTARAIIDELEKISEE